MFACLADCLCLSWDLLFVVCNLVCVRLFVFVVIVSYDLLFVYYSGGVVGGLFV